jgi:predicted metal-binding membrane protein
MIALVRCRNPFLCVDNPTRSSTSSFLHGLREGLYCALCCSGLMLSFLALGIMNAWFMIAIAALIALEKILPRPRWIVYASGAAGITAGLAIVILTVL